MVISSVIAIVLIAFTSFAFSERNKALNQKEIAYQKTEEAKTSEQSALSAKNAALFLQEKAERSEKHALSEKQQAELSKREALLAKGSAEKATLEARQNWIQAKQNADLAKMETDRATKALSESEKAKQEAIESKIGAEKAEKEASRISNLSTAQNIALKSALFNADPQLQGLLALQAYRITLENGGEVQDPTIYKAIRSSFFNLNKQASISHLITEVEQRTLLMPDANTLLSADKNGTIFKWERKSEKQIDEAKLGYFSPFEIITFTDWTNIVMSGHENGTVCIWDISDFKKPVLVKELKKSHIGPLRIIACNGLNSLIATAGKDSCVLVWKYSSAGTELVKKIKTNSPIQDVVILNDGKELCIAKENGELEAIDIASEKTNLIFKSEKSIPWNLKLNEEKNILAVGYSNGKIKLFDIGKISGTESEIFTFSENTTTVEKMVFNSSGTMLAATFADKSIKIFNLAHKAQKPVGVRDTKSKTRCMMFDSENILYACGADHIIRKIEPSTEKIATPFCELLKRNLTPIEWTQNISQTIPYEKTCK